MLRMVILPVRLSSAGGGVNVHLRVNGHKISAKAFCSDHPSIKLLKINHQELHDFVNASQKKIRETPKYEALRKVDQILQKVRYDQVNTYETENGVCPYGCNYYFFSKADRDRHFKLMSHKNVHTK